MKDLRVLRQSATKIENARHRGPNPFKAPVASPIFVGLSTDKARSISTGIRPSQ